MKVLGKPGEEQASVERVYLREGFMMHEICCFEFLQIFVATCSQISRPTGTYLPIKYLSFTFFFKKWEPILENQPFAVLLFPERGEVVAVDGQITRGEGPEQRAHVKLKDGIKAVQVMHLEKAQLEFLPGFLDALSNLSSLKLFEQVFFDFFVLHFFSGMLL